MASSTSNGGACGESSSTSLDVARFMRSWRDRFTAMHPVIVRRCELDDEWGDTTITQRKGEPVFLVRVHKSLAPESQIFVLVHELAHCLQWRINEDSRQNDHDAEFGVCYARIWAEMFGG